MSEIDAINEGVDVQEWEKPIVIGFNQDELQRAGELARATAICSTCW